MTAKVMDHEMMRFSTMTPRQLLTRLYRITKPEKLQAYITTAERLGYNSLAQAAIEKRDGIRKETPINAVFVSPILIDKQNKTIEKKAIEITRDIVYTRSLDF